jgi:outer membrane protein
MQKNYDAYNNAINQLQTQKENYQLSQQLLNLVMQRFQLGQATIVDVKQAQQSFETEGFRLTNLQYAAKIAEINMLLLANQLSY